MAKTHWVLGTLLLAGFAASCNNTGGAASPRLKSVPLQKVGGGTTFTLDVASFVTDDTQTATYAVLSGGGSFNGSVYSRMFPTLGTYTVTFKVTDFRGNEASGSFEVRVTSAEIALVRTGTGASLLDLQTSNFVAALQDDGRAKAFKVALADGSMVFEVTQSGQADLWLYNPNLAGTDVFAGDSTKPETYALKTSKNLVLYSKGTAPARSLQLYNPTSKGTQLVSAGLSGRDERNPKISSSDMIYFESASGPNGDIWVWDVSQSKATAVSTNAKPEEIVAVLPNGGAVFRRRGGANEWDLFYYEKSVGVLEIGADLSAAINLESKTYKAAVTGSRVVFETTNGTGDEDLYVWNPADATTRTIASSAVDETYVATSGSGRIVYRIFTGLAQYDLAWFDAVAGNGGAIASSTDTETYNGTLSNGDIIYSRNTGAQGLDLYHWVQANTTGTAFPGAAASATSQVFAKVLTNNDVVYTTGTDLFLYRPSNQNVTSIVTGAGTETLAGETSGGDFVIQLVNGANTHLWLWDSSANAAVAVSNTAGVASYQNASSAGVILFARTATGQTQSELYTWTPASSATAQVTTTAVNDTVDSVFKAKTQ